MSGDDASVDRKHLDRLGSRFGQAFVVEMIDLFITQGEDRLVAARGALTAGDAEGIASAAHSLKSSAGNLGATSLSALAAEAERLGRSGAPAADLAPHVQAIAEELERVTAALRSVRDGLPA